MPNLDRIDATYLTMISDAFVEMEELFSDGEVGALLVGSGLEDVFPNSGRHGRLLNALKNQQNLDGGADTIAIFLRRSGQHLQRRKGDEAVNKFREKINAVLSYAGYELDSNCEFKTYDAASKPIYARSDAETRAESLNKGVKQRRLHPDILLSTRPEYITDSGYFRCVLEASKLLQEKLRAKTGLRVEGPQIAEHALSFSMQRQPLLLLNDFRTENDQAEQFTLMCMLKGLLLTFQDEQTRVYREGWQMDFDDALDLLSLISFFHRKIDRGRKCS